MRRDTLLYDLGRPSDEVLKSKLKQKEDPAADKEIKQGATGKSGGTGTKESRADAPSATVKEDIVYIRDEAGTVYAMSEKDYQELSEELNEEIRKNIKENEEAEQPAQTDWLDPYLGDDDDTSSNKQRRTAAKTDNTINSAWLGFGAAALLLIVVAADDEK